jgi:DNA-binding response OmpR family regulator
VRALGIAAGLEQKAIALPISIGRKLALSWLFTAHGKATMADLSTNGTTILLLVSDALMREVLRDALNSAGYLVVVAAEIGAAVDRLRETRPALLITRPYINSMPGQMAADYLRTKQPGLPILIVSGFMEDDRVRDRNAIDDFHIFPRPFSRDELLKKVNEVLLEIRKRDLPSAYSR